MGGEENESFSALAGYDILVELRDIVLFAKWWVHICMGTNCASMKEFVMDQAPVTEESLGRTPALLPEGYRVSRQDADHTRKHLEPSPLGCRCPARKTQLCSRQSFQQMLRKVAALLIASLIL